MAEMFPQTFQDPTGDHNPYFLNRILTCLAYDEDKTMMEGGEDAQFYELRLI
jgi:hypothetical protein